MHLHKRSAGGAAEGGGAPVWGSSAPSGRGRGMTTVMQRPCLFASSIMSSLISAYSLRKWMNEIKAQIPGRALAPIGCCLRLGQLSKQAGSWNAWQQM
jgi:hypothetical protein